MNLASFFDYPTTTQPATPELAPFLHHWQQRQWQKLLALTQARRYSAGDLVLQAGATERALYLVAFGELEVLNGAPTANGLTPGLVIEQGGVVGEQSFLDEMPQPYAVQAVTESEALRLSFDAFTIFAAREPELARELLLALGRLVSRRLRQLQQSITATRDYTKL
ncbi:MAG: cyclic nucleotide-binding domain-containing protein [Caldilineaceae bacterium]